MNKKIINFNLWFSREQQNDWETIRFRFCFLNCYSRTVFKEGETEEEPFNYLTSFNYLKKELFE